MASRYPSVRTLDYCLSPVSIYIDGERLQVPCGKCNGCLLHKANEWSMRVGCEIEATRFPYFFTLTYNNKYLPTFILKERVLKNGFYYKVWTCNHDKNIRFDSKKDVLRNEDIEDIVTSDSFDGVLATNYVSDVPYFAYSSKRDIQLLLKILRKSIDEKFPKKTKQEKALRYFIISEYGETLLRPHFHGILFVNDREVSEFIIYGSLFESWKMCDSSQFFNYAHLCDSGCRGYITQYLTCFSSLPSVYKENGNIRPFRLSSKSPAIGYSEYDKAKIFEDVITGVIEFRKDISRLNEQYVLCYPSQVMRGLFPKCYEFRKYNFSGLCKLYGLVYNLLRKSTPTSYDVVKRLHEQLNPLDWQAQVTCAKWCRILGITPHTYVYALDMYYYKAAMSALKFWYQWQESKGNVLEVLRSYQNFNDWLSKWKNNMTSTYENLVFGCFCESFVLNPYDTQFIEENDSFLKINEEYVNEVDSILSNMEKMPKFNEKFGLSPNSVY